MNKPEIIDFLTRLASFDLTAEGGEAVLENSEGEQMTCSHIKLIEALEQGIAKDELTTKKSEIVSLRKELGNIPIEGSNFAYSYCSSYYFRYSGPGLEKAIFRKDGTVLLVGNAPSYQTNLLNISDVLEQIQQDYQDESISSSLRSGTIEKFQKEAERHLNSIVTIRPLTTMEKVCGAVAGIFGFMGLTIGDKLGGNNPAIQAVGDSFNDLLNKIPPEISFSATASVLAAPLVCALLQEAGYEKPMKNLIKVPAAALGAAVGGIWMGSSEICRPAMKLLNDILAVGIDFISKTVDMAGSAIAINPQKATFLLTAAACTLCAFMAHEISKSDRRETTKQ